MKVLVYRDTNGGSPDTLFVDIEDDRGNSVKYDWTERGDGYWEIDLGVDEGVDAALAYRTARETIDGLKREVAGQTDIHRRLQRELQSETKLVEVYEWLFEHNSCVGRDSAIREDGQVWVVYDVDGDVVSRGRDAEEAAWGAWDLAH
jgi:hypothetical protein